MRGGEWGHTALIWKTKGPCFQNIEIVPQKPTVFLAFHVQLVGKKIKSLRSDLKMKNPPSGMRTHTQLMTCKHFRHMPFGSERTSQPKLQVL